MNTSEKGKNLIRNFEGLRLKAYRCSSNRLTIGYGHTANVKESDIITKEQAENYLTQDLKRFENAVNRLVKVSLTQNQFDALVSFAFNLGEYNLQKSTLLKMLNEKKYNEAANQFERWCLDAQNRPLEGLKRRRRAEKELFLMK